MQHLRYLILVCCILVAGCVTQGAVNSFTIYKTTFDESKQASQALIDRLAAAERNFLREVFFAKNNDGSSSKFNPDEAALFSKLKNPRLTREYELSLSVINEYNELMFAYATGNGFDGLIARIDRLAEAGLALGGAVSGKSIGSIGARVAIKTGLGFVASQRSKAVFSQKFRETSPILLDLIDELRRQTPTVFKYLTAAAENNDAYMVERILLSDWVILLEKQADLIRATQRAIDNPSVGDELDTATETIIQLRVAIAQIKEHLKTANGQ